MQISIKLSISLLLLFSQTSWWWGANRTTMSPPPAAIIIQQRGSTANGLALAFTSSVTVGDGLVSCVGHDNGVGTLTVSDTLGNIWTKTADIGWLGNAAAQTCAFTKTASGGADTVHMGRYNYSNPSLLRFLQSSQLGIE